MTRHDELEIRDIEDRSEPLYEVVTGWTLNRRSFVQVLGAGLLISVQDVPVLAQRRGRGGGREPRIAARIHVGREGKITVLSGKIEMGQGARGELSQAAAEELRVPLDRVEMLLADTSLVPDDGITAGSRTTPSTVPAVRRGAAAARHVLVQLACRRWNVPDDSVEVHDGQITQGATGRTITYAELAAMEDLAQVLDVELPADIRLTPVSEWKVMGRPTTRPGLREFVTGAHKYPSDLVPEDGLRGKVLRPPSYGARLRSIDLSPAQAMKDVVVLRDGDFVGVAAATTHRAKQALDAIAKTAVWEAAPHPSSGEVFDYLRTQAGGAVPKNPYADDIARAAQSDRQTYHVAYVQHVPLETRAALAEWKDDNLTVWTGTQNPFGYHGELARAFGLSNEQVRVIVPDFGCGFGGKHTGEAAIEAARLARAAGRPVTLHWTREEEFTWAYFRPAAVIDVQASLDQQGAITSWYFVNINSGGAALRTPYRIANTQEQFVRADSPVRQGSYRVLAATANNFARECFMDELAGMAGADPLDFRLAHLENQRIRDVLQEATRRFGWREKVARKVPNVGVGLACGTEKGSVVAACVEILLEKPKNQIVVRRVCEVFECGAIVNPDNLWAQVQGCIIMGLGPALREEVRFESGKNLTTTFDDYYVPHFRDVPELDIHLLNRPDLESAGGGETPLIALAPAIANAVYHATGQRIREMPIRLSETG